MSASVGKDLLKVVRTLALGALALLGGTLALAQVGAPPAQKGRIDENAAPRAQAQPAPSQDRSGQRPTFQNERGRAQPDRTQADRQAGRDQRAGSQDARRGRDGAPRQELGIQFDPQVQDGLAISNVQQSSLAADAGLKAGDRIVSVDGRQIAQPRQFQAYLSGQYGREIPVVVSRDGQQQTIYLSAGSQSENAAWLGVFLNDNQENQRGAMVMQVYPAGPAARAGLRPRDVITHINGQEVAGSVDLIAAIEQQEPGSKADFNVLRNDQELKLTATLGSRDNFVLRGQGGDFGRGGEFDRGGRWGQDDEYSNIPPYAMQLEHDRRVAEQHERLENQMAKLTEEVRQLRELIQQQQRR